MDEQTIKNRIIRKILETVKNNHTFFITAHCNPDGDTLGSELALGSWLKRLGKKVTIVNADPVPVIYRFLPGISRIKRKKKIGAHFDVAFILECSNPERFGGIVDLDKQFDTVVSIDHHFSSESYGDVNWFDSKASATAEQIYELIRASGAALTDREALSLYIGILTDTGRFQQKNTTPQTHQIVAELLSHRIHPDEIHARVYATKSYPLLKLLGLTLDSLKLAAGGKVAYQEITREMLEKSGTEQHEEDTINYPLTIPQVKISILFREMVEEKNKIKVGFRSRNKVDVHRIAEHFNGGGHQNASGCVIEGSLRQVENSVLGYIGKIFSS